MEEDTEKKDQEELVKEMTKELGVAVALDAYKDSEGGKILVKGLISDIIGAIESITTNTSALTINDFITLSVRIKERLDVIRALNGAKTNREILEEELKKELEKIQQ